MKIGEYVRTDYGVSKILDIMPELIRADSETMWYLTKDLIKKTSPNLIDLIEVDDYVNGYKVQYVSEHNLDLENHSTVEEFEIKEILTKEQYERAVYRV